MFERLLVPLDGSRLAEVALPVAERLAKSFDGTILLLHILERGAPAKIHGEPHLTDAAHADAYLEQIAADLRGRGIATIAHAHHVPEGHVPTSIVAHAAEEQADVIVLCTHGGGTVRGWLTGTIAQQVLQRGTAPVLLVRAALPATPEPFAPTAILVALDATSASEAALGPAVLLARKLGARLHLTMVVETPATVRGDRAQAAALMPLGARAMLDLEEREAATYLRHLTEQLHSPDLVIETEVRRGDAADQLADDVVEHRAGLVVAATHGKAGLQAIWAGSVAARLLSRTAAPVLLLRRADG